MGLWCLHKRSKKHDRARNGSEPHVEVEAVYIFCTTTLTLVVTSLATSHHWVEGGFLVASSASMRLASLRVPRLLNMEWVTRKMSADGKRRKALKTASSGH